jgi:predicted nucleic acid-binding Zn ribbon protein
VRLHPDTAIQIAAEQERRSRPTRLALIGVLVLIVAVLALHWHGAF